MQVFIMQVFKQNFGKIHWNRLYETNWKKLRGGMKRKGVDSLIVEDMASVKYLTGYSPMNSFFMLNTMVVRLAVEG